MQHSTRDGQPLRTGHFLGLKFDGGWWFVQVLSTSQLELKPWQLPDDNGNKAEIPAQTAGTYDEIRDNNDQLLLEPGDDERSQIFQIFVGAAPSRVQLYPQFGREQNLGLETSIAPGEDEIWTDGFNSPYGSITAPGELFYMNNMSRLRLTAYNPTDTAFPAKLSFFVNKIKYATVTDVNLMKAMLQNQVTAKKHPVGLGATDKDQLSPPEWVSNAFGEHIYSTKEILSEGDTSQVSNNLDIREGVDLQGGGN